MDKQIVLVGASEELSTQLESMNARLNEAFRLYQTNGRAVLKKVREIVPDCILVDSSVLHKEESQIFQLLKQNNISYRIPVILLTNDPEEDNLSELFNLGLTDFILKPLKVKELVYRMNWVQEKLSERKIPEQGHWAVLNVEAKSSVNGVVLLDADGKVDWVNEGFEQIYGQPFKEYLEKYGHYIFSENSRGFQLMLDKFKNGEKGLTVAHQIRTKSSDKKWIETTLTPLFDDYGNLTKIIAVETDISGVLLEKKRTEKLLSNILPFEVIEQMKIKGTVRSKKYKRVTVLFADFKNFTGLAKTMGVDELISELNRYVWKFDEIIEKHYIEKIKTIGDAYMCAGGLPLRNYSNPFDVTLASLEIQKFVRNMAIEKEARGEYPWELRLGIHTGEVMAGVIGNQKLAYDIWGNTVNIAARMEETSREGRVNVSGATYEYIKDYFECIYRGKVRMKNNPEEVDMYLVNRLKPEYSEDEEGIRPNAAFRKILAKY
ncbi:MAG: PAS domain-containing protein [Bacteroidales bacterium]|nr:PAS domain-containing protein [Bacteroidales bacterium]